MAGMGLDARIMSSTDEELKKKVGVLAYVKAGLTALFEGRRMTLQYRVDGGAPKVAKVHTVLVGNVGTIARGVTLMPDASLTDGALDVVAVRPTGPFGWLLVAWRVLVDNAFLRRLKPARLRERDDNARELRYLQCSHIDVVLRDPEDIELDGDIFGEIRAVSVEVVPGALTIMVPSH
ncbi:diacylglycerol/lipid kinase family protein [Tessaracoccus coleopterorum]|uniref:diacylglycerol/lipid kinase family protein n=1 Tax=Tessaracoccus coleopterorum TaxID=2714950 RepID=UPI002F91BC4C